MEESDFSLICLSLLVAGFRRASYSSFGHASIQHTISTKFLGACHYLTNRFQMKAPVAPSRSLREAFKRAPRSLRGACLREGFAEPPRRHHEPFAEVYEPFALRTLRGGCTYRRFHEDALEGSRGPLEGSVDELHVPTRS